MKRSILVALLVGALVAVSVPFVARRVRSRAEVEEAARVAVEAHRDGRARDALAAFDRVLALDPTLRFVPFDPLDFRDWLLADLIEMGRPNDALRILDGLGGESALPPRLLHHLGRVRYLEGSPGRAEAAWNLAVARDPNLAGPWRGLGELSAARGDVEKAATCFEKAAVLDPNDPSTFYQWSLLERRRGGSERAGLLKAKADALREGRKPSQAGMSEMPEESR